MKRYIKEFLDFLLGSPVLPMLVIAVSLFSAFFTSDSIFRQDGQVDEVVPVLIEVPVTTAVSTTVSASTSTRVTSTTASTSAVTSTSAAGTEAVGESEHHGDGQQTAAPSGGKPADNGGSGQPNQPAQPPTPAAPTYNYTYISAGESPNSGFYQPRLTIVGDSIASGFCAYGYIPAGHNVAKESLAVWNMGRYTFDMGGGSMGLIDAAAYVNTPLYFVSIGMNDIFSFTPEDYAARIKIIAEQILEKVPTATVVVGAITPVSSGNYYTGNDRIDSFNAALENTINEAESPQMIFFNTNAALKDPNTGCLTTAYGGGDGLHLNSSAYRFVLNCLFNFLDESEVMDQINEHDSQFE